MDKSTVGFTRGPWVAQDHGHVSCVGQNGASGYRVANAFGLTLTSFQEAEANARLIAAAPELYEALAALVRAEDDEALIRGDGLFYDARKALANARGE